MPSFKLDIIAEDRGNKSFYTAFAFSLVSALFYVAITYFAPEFISICPGSSSLISTWEQNLQFILTLNVFTFLGLFVFEVVRRLFLLVEEWKHRDKRYEGNWLKLLKKVFGFEGLYQIGFVLLVCLAFVIFLLATKNYPQDGTWNLMIHVLLAQIGIAPCIAYGIKMKSLSAVEEDDLNEKSLLNIAQGLAWSYYIGYLKLILPGFEERIVDPKNTIKVKKLLILFPYSCLMHDSLESNRKNSTSALGRTEIPYIKDHIADVGGIKNRNYHNTVYKITSDGKKEHLIVEYCTPLNTIYVMSEKNPHKFSENKKKEQMQLLAKTVKNLLDNDVECRDKYELIIYNDEAKGFNLDEFLLDELESMKSRKFNETNTSINQDTCIDLTEQEMKPLCNGLSIA